MRTLLYSAKAAAEIYNGPPSKAKLADGRIVDFTAQVSWHSNWRKDYRWPDAVEVGSIDDSDQIISYGKHKDDTWGV